MLEGKELILATRKYAVEDRSKSWTLLLSTLVLLGLALFGAYYPFHIAIRIACSLIASLLLVRTFVINHDYLHGALLKDSPLATAIFTVFGWYILVPRSVWKRSHDYHHAHNSKLFSSSIGSFPIVTMETYETLSPGQRMKYLFIRHPLTIAGGYVFAFLWGMCLLPLLRSPSKHWDAGVALLFHFGIGITAYVTLGPLAFLLGFLIPAVVSSAMGSYLFYAQHNFPGVTFSTRDEWTYIQAALDSSSYMKMSRLMHWFTANIGFHHIHHTNSRIPFYRLREVYNEMPEFRVNAKTTSLNPVDIAKCFQLKVWDPAKGKMIGFREMRSAQV